MPSQAEKRWFDGGERMARTSGAGPVPRPTEGSDSPDATAFAPLLADLVHQFASASQKPTDTAIGEALVQVCRAMNLNACALLRTSEGGGDLIEAYTWSDGPSDVAALLPPAAERPSLARGLLTGETVRVPDAPEPVADPSAPRPTRATLLLPLSICGEVVGALAVGTTAPDWHWPPPLEAQLRTVADLIAAVLARARWEQEARHLQAEVHRLREHAHTESVQARREIQIDRRYEHIVGRSPALARVVEQAEQVATTDSIVLLSGETGTGKELFAELIHDLSPRRGKPMVKVNCAALPPSLVESELFGRERGAYTGALTREIGRFELAHQSTIFLDELGELPLDLQAKLLRVLQGGEFERVGSPKTIRVNVRIIAATNRDLKRAVAENRFREDLYYRLNVFPVEIPPLRERPEDIPMLAWAFAGEFGNAMGKTIETIPQAGMDALQRYPWPGNVRELRNVIERAMIVTTGGTLRVAVPQSASAGPDKSGPTNLRDLERQHILEVMRQTRWRVRGAGGAAELLGLKPTTLEARMAKLGISRSTPADVGT